MKIVCDACQAKYSISDDKVQGKVFKIRCKKCSNIIVVRGNAGAAEPAPAPQQEKDTRVYDYGYEGGDHAPAGDESVWHVVINQDQVGPMTAVEVQQRFAGGEIDAETYIWREGFSDWLPLSQVDTFASLTASGGGAAVAPRGGGANAVASMFGPGGGEEGSTGRSDPGDLFAAASASAARNDDDGGDLFGSKPAAAQANQGNAKLRGERNENSVLFSLNNLAQLASDKPAPAPTHSSSSSSSPSSLGAATGAAGGEGSGLIDIRSMASAYLGGPGGGPAKPVSAGVGSMDDLPVFGGGGFSEPAVIVPISARSNNNKLMYALIGSVGLLAVAAVIVVVVMLKGGDKTVVASAGDKTATASDKDNDTKAADTKAADTKAADTKAPDTKAADTKAPDTKAPDTKAPDTKAPDTKAPDTKVAANDTPTEPKHPAPVVHKQPASNPPPTQPKGGTKPPVEKATAPAAKDPPPAKDSGGGCDEVSCVLNNYEGACCAKFKKGGGKAPSGGTGGTGAAPKGGGDVPESLDRAMISDGVGKVKARVTSCGEKSSAHGTVKVSVKVGPDGHVASVSVKTPLDPGIDNCVVGIMQKAMFAKTQNGGSFSYPYTF